MIAAPDVLPAWPAFLEEAALVLHPSLGEAGILSGLRSSDADHAAGHRGERTAVANQERHPPLPGVGAGISVVRELRRPADEHPASAFLAVRGTADEAGSALPELAAAQYIQVAARFAG